MGKKQQFRGNNNGFYPAWGYLLILLVMGCSTKAPVQTMDTISDYHSFTIHEYITDKQYEKALMENSESLAMLTLLADNTPVPVTWPRKDAEIHALLLKEIMDQKKQTQALLKKIDTLEKKNADTVQQKKFLVTRLQDKVKELELKNTDLEQQINSYKEIDLGLDAVNYETEGSRDKNPQ